MNRADRTAALRARRQARGMDDPLTRLRHHVTGAIERGEAVPIIEQRPEPTPGELAYIEDCRRCPLYHDGTTRKTWRQLPAYARNTWEKNPTPRDYRAKDYAP